MKGYVRASRYYYDAALAQKDGRVVPGPNYEEVVEITAKHTGARPEIIRSGFPTRTETAGCSSPTWSGR